MGHDFRVRFGGERVTFLLQLFLELEVVLDNAVVDDNDFAGAVAMRMGILLSRTAMRGPARMTDAVSAIKRRFGDDFFELAQAFYDNRHNLLGPDIPDYPTHARSLLIAFLEA